MLKWIFVLFLVVVGYFAFQNRSLVVSHWNEAVAQLNQMQPPGNVSPDGKTATGNKANASSSQIAAPAAWSLRDVGGLRVNTPFNIEAITPAGTAGLPSHIRVAGYFGKSGVYKFGVLHLQNTMLAGGLMLGWADGPLGKTADRLNMTVISQNSATVLLNGFRARRSDYVSRTTPRIRVRAVLLEKGNQAWFLEYHAPETDPDAERAFLQMADSARAL